MSESTIEKALLEAEQLEETMKSNAKEILSSTMREEINELVKESLSEKDDYLKEQEDTEQEVDIEMEMEPMGDMDMGMELDIEDETDDMDISAELPPLDLTLASDEEVIKVFKAMGSEDGVIIQQDDDEISLVDGSEEYLIKLEENKNKMKQQEPMYEIEMDVEDEPMYEIELDESGEHTHDEEGNVMGVDAPESENALAGYEDEGGEMMEEEPVYEIELDEEDGEPGHHEHPEYQLKQGYDDTEDESLGMRRGKGSGKKQSMKARRDDSYGDYGKRGNEHEMGEASRTLGFYRGKNAGGSSGLRKGITNNRNLQEARTTGRLQEDYNRLHEEVSNLKGKNGEYRKALVSFKQKLNEVGVFNSNLAYATRLFTEHSTTKQEKINILRRFDNVKSIKESKGLYRILREDFSQNNSSTKSKKSISEAVDRKINSTPASGSNIRLTETKAYENPQFSRIKDLMSKIK